MKTEQQKVIYEAIKLEPEITLSELRDDLGVSYNSVRYAVRQLIENGYIEKKKVFIIL